MKQPVRLTEEYHWEQNGNRKTTGAATKPARTLFAFHPLQFIFRLAVLMLILGLVALVYYAIRNRNSDPMPEQQATAEAAGGIDLSVHGLFSLVIPVDATLPSTIVASEGEPIPTIEAATPAAATLCGDKAGRVVGDAVKSRTLGVTLPVDIYLPPCYDDKKYTYPTLYLIQGLGYVRGQWADDGVATVADRAILSGQLPPFIMVMPANDSMSGSASRFVYTSRGDNSWEGFITNELIPTMDNRYSTWGNRDGRAIGGISRGGYWALEIAFTHTSLFSAVGGHSPAITSDYLVGTPDDFSMLDLVRTTDSLKSLRIFLDAGLGDVTQNGVYQLASELGAKKLTYVGRIGTGKHDDVYWSSQLGNYLRFYAATWPMQPRSK
ncbi:MAG TPA: alpha/beta hydrolase-fold protein [Anaerolineae bacterium]